MYSRRSAKAKEKDSPARSTRSHDTIEDEPEQEPTPSKTTKPTVKTPKSRSQLVWSGPPDENIGMEWPPGWRKESYSRGSTGTSAKQRDKYWFTPVKNIRLRSIPDVKRFLNALPLCDNDEEQAFLHTNESKKRVSTGNNTPRKKPKQAPARPKQEQASPKKKPALPKKTPAPLPQPPKEPRSAYDLFYQELRPTLEVNDPEQKLQNMWGSLSAQFQESYHAKASQDRIRYWTELEAYAAQQKKRVQDDSAAGNTVSDGAAVAVPVAAATPVAAKAASAKPKKASTAYNCFFKVHRAKIFEVINNPSANAADSPYYIDDEWMAKFQNNERSNTADATRLIVERWKALTVEERAPYSAMAQEDTKRYQQEMSSYNQGSYQGPATATATKKPRRKKDKNEPKRKISAYNYFFKLEREKVMRFVNGDTSSNVDWIEPDVVQRLHLDNGKTNVSLLVQLVGNRWKQLTDDEKEPYKQMAAEDAERYQQELQAYEEKKSVAADKKEGENTNGEDPGGETEDEATDAEALVKDGSILNLAP